MEEEVKSRIASDQYGQYIESIKETKQAGVPSGPWAHRSQGMKCKTCMWFAPKTGTTINRPYDLGRCRRHAPTMNGYPVVFVNDWCGDHKLDENKI